MKPFRIITIFVLVLVTFAAGYRIYNNNPGSELEGKFKKIKKGMSADEVIRILGKPVQISRPDSFTYEYTYSSGVMGKSTEPYVLLDSTKNVVSASYGD